jgi:hypothetical protein
LDRTQPFFEFRIEIDRKRRDHNGHFRFTIQARTDSSSGIFDSRGNLVRRSTFDRERVTRADSQRLLPRLIL